MAEWQISKPLGVCAGSGLQINPGNQYYGALIEGQEDLERQDFSVEFWQKNKPDVYCYWKTTMPDETLKKKIFVDDDMLMSFFERLEDETDQEKADFRFVLMLVLMRKRLLKYLGSRKSDAGEIWQLKKMSTKETIEVLNPELSEDSIGQLRDKIGQIMQGELE